MQVAGGLFINTSTSFKFDTGSSLTSSGSVVFNAGGTITERDVQQQRDDGTGQCDTRQQRARRAGASEPQAGRRFNLGREPQRQRDVQLVGRQSERHRADFVPANDTLTVGSVTLDGRHLSVDGTVSMGQNSLIQTGNGTVIDVNATGTLDMAGDNQISYFGGTRPAVNVAGLLKKSAGTGTSSIDAEFTDSHITQVLTGTLDLAVLPTRSRGCWRYSRRRRWALIPQTRSRLRPVHSSTAAGRWSLISVELRRSTAPFPTPERRSLTADHW